MSIERRRINEILELHSDLQGQWEIFRKTTLPKALRVGELLTEQKAELDHGKWLPWVARNLPSITVRTVQNYMRLHRERNRLKNETVSHLAEAYRLLIPERIEIPVTPAPEPKPLPSLDDYAEATVKVMFKLKQRLEHVRGNTENILSESVHTELGLHVQDLVPVLLSLDAELSQEEKTERKPVAQTDTVTETPYYLTENRLSFIKERLDKITDLLDVQIDVHAPVSLIRIEVKNLKAEVLKLRPYRTQSKGSKPVEQVSAAVKCLPAVIGS